MTRRNSAARIARMAGFCAANLVLLDSQALAQASSPASAATPVPAAPAGTGAPSAAPTATKDTPITVTGARQDGTQQIDRRSYALGKDIQAATGSVADALRNVPSVQVSPQGQVSLRGDSRVTIYVDGKPSPMFNGQSRGQILQQIPATQFERIELLTNPSATMSAEGSGGIINLVSKQNKTSATSATITLNGGTRERHNGSISVSKPFGKLSASADFGWRRDVVSGSVDDVRNATTGSIASAAETATFYSSGTSFNGRGGLDYDVNPKNRLSAEGHFTSSSFLANQLSIYEGSNALAVPQLHFERDGATRYDRSSIGGSADWRYKIAGNDHLLTLHFGHDRSTDDQANHSAVTFLTPTLPASQEAITINSTQDVNQLKLEYKRPLPGKVTLVTGYELGTLDSDYENKTERGPSTGALAVIPSLSNRFLYDQTIHAGYLTVQQPWGKFVGLVGLRAENTSLRLNQISTAQLGEQDYLRLFPSVHLQYKPKGPVQFSASYSRRIVRPSANDLNPFRTYLDSKNFQQGNLALRPEMTDSFEFGLERRKGANFMQATLYRRVSSNGITEVIQDLGDGALLTTKGNLSKTRSTGLEVVQSWRLTSKLNVTMTGSAVDQQIVAPVGTAMNTRSGVILSGFVSFNYRPTQKDTLQISGFVTGKRLIPQGYHEPTGMLNLGYRHSFSPKLQFVFTGQDVLRTFHDRLVLDSPGLHEVRDQRANLRGFYIGISYNFSGRPSNRPQSYDQRPQSIPGAPY